MSKGAALFITEFGASPADGGVSPNNKVCEAEANNWFSWMATNNISGTAWKLAAGKDSSNYFTTAPPVDGPFPDSVLSQNNGASPGPELLFPPAPVLRPEAPLPVPPEAPPLEQPAASRSAIAGASTQVNVDTLWATTGTDVMSAPSNTRSAIFLDVEPAKTVPPRRQYCRALTSAERTRRPTAGKSKISLQTAIAAHCQSLERGQLGVAGEVSARRHLNCCWQTGCQQLRSAFSTRGSRPGRMWKPSMHSTLPGPER